MRFHQIRGKVSGEQNTAVVGNRATHTVNSHNPVKYIYNLANNPKRTTTQTIQLLAASVLAIVVLAGVVVGLVFLIMGIAQKIGGSSKSGVNAEASHAAPSSFGSTALPTLSITSTPSTPANNTPTQTTPPVPFPFAAYSNSPYRTAPPPFLTQAKNYGNCDACSKCNNSTAFINDCHEAVNLFVDDEGYINHTRLAAGNCYADWTCSGEYTKKLGKDIKNVFNYGLFGSGGCEACGQWFLMDGSNCHGTIQAIGC